MRFPFSSGHSKCQKPLFEPSTSHDEPTYAPILRRRRGLSSGGGSPATNRRSKGVPLPDCDFVVSNWRDIDFQSAGIEIKASATVKAGDFGGLRALAEACGDRFAFGVVLYDNTDVVPFGDKLAAAPLSSMWG